MMKNLFGLKKMFMASLALAMVVSVASCKQDDDDSSSNSSSGGSSVTLPASVGNNVFKGKTWERTYSEGSSSSSESVAFSDSTVTFANSWTEEGESGSSSKVYNYSYDETKSLVYMSFKSASGTAPDGSKISYSSVSEFEALLNKFAAEEGMSAEEKAAEIASFKAELERKTVYKYTISGNSLTLADYFGGTLPSEVEFQYEESGFHIRLRDDRVYLDEWGSSSDVDGRAENVTFSNGSFSGKLYDKHDEETEIGDVAGTYTISGEGSSATVTVKFTSLPSVYKTITANTEYTLTQSDSEEGETYTLKQ